MTIAKEEEDMRLRLRRARRTTQKQSSFRGIRSLQLPSSPGTDQNKRERVQSLSVIQRSEQADKLSLPACNSYLLIKKTKLIYATLVELLCLFEI